MRIIIGADFVPTESNVALFNKGAYKDLLGVELSELLSEANYRIFNLEVPLVDSLAPISKCGPNLIAPTSAIKLYDELNVNLLTLANNHILDQDIQGLESTIQVLKKQGIDYVGVGTKEQAPKPHVFKIDGKKIGIYACSEHEFSIVGDFEKGANPFDPLESLEHIQELKKVCDFVIVLYHGGKEHYRYPSPNLQKTCRKMVEKGANLIVCQHSHCIGCEEKYKDGTIVYGQGNFLFDYSKSDFWSTSLLISIDENFKIGYIPLIKKDNGVRLADKRQADQILLGFNRRTEAIKSNGFIEERYIAFSKEMLEGYCFALSGIKHGLVSKVLNKLSRNKYLAWKIKKRLTKKRLLSIRNFVECEAHRELMIKGFKEFYE